MVPIYLLAFACFWTARLAGAGTGNGSSLRRVDSILRLLGLLTLQHRLLQFSPQRHHVPYTDRYTLPKIAISVFPCFKKQGISKRRKKIRYSMVDTLPHPYATDQLPLFEIWAHWCTLSVSEFPPQSQSHTCTYTRESTNELKWNISYLAHGVDIYKQ